MKLPRAMASAEPAGRAVKSALWFGGRARCIRGAWGIRGALRTARPTLGHVRRCGFTLIELILVMAILTMAASVTAPALSRFFRGRTLDAEARRLLSLTHSGQSRAVAEGVPVDLWLDVAQGRFGLQLEPSYETSDPKAAEFDLDSGLRFEVVARTAAAPARTPVLSTGRLASTASVPRVALAHPELPTIRFLPDGSISESSPEKLRLVAHDGSSLWLVQTSDHLAYEIRATDK